MKIKYKKGFTLIELLVVIAIIGLLSSIVLASLKNARQKVIDTKTVANLKSLNTAMQIYGINNAYLNNNGGETYHTYKYPPYDYYYSNFEPFLRPLVTSKSIGSIPNHPAADNSDYFVYSPIQLDGQLYDPFWAGDYALDIKCGTKSLKNYYFAIYTSTNTKLKGLDTLYVVDSYGNVYNLSVANLASNGVILYCIGD